jgi:DnaJ-class molecular chaperone
MYLSDRIALDILGLRECKSHYSYDDIKKAYKAKALRHHPDKTDGKSTSEFLKISAAYEFLRATVKDPSDHTSHIHNFNISPEMFCKLTASLIKLIHKVLHEQYTDQHQNRNQEHKAHDRSSSSSPYDQEHEEFFDFEEEEEEVHEGKSVKRHCHIDITIAVTLRELYTELGKKIVIKYIDSQNSIRTREIVVPFIKYQRCMICTGFGDWNKHTKQYDDLYIRLHIENDQEYSINDCINDFDLIRCVKISVSDFYNTLILNIDHFGETLQLKHTPCTDGKEIIVPQQGLRTSPTSRGVLYILLSIDMDVCNHTELHAHMHSIKQVFIPQFQHITNG